MDSNVEQIIKGPAIISHGGKSFQSCADVGKGRDRGVCVLRVNKSTKEGFGEGLRLKPFKLNLCGRLSDVSVSLTFFNNCAQGLIKILTRQPRRCIKLKRRAGKYNY